MSRVWISRSTLNSRNLWNLVPAKISACKKYDCFQIPGQWLKNITHQTQLYMTNRNITINLFWDLLKPVKED